MNLDNWYGALHQKMTFLLPGKRHGVCFYPNGVYSEAYTTMMNEPTRKHVDVMNVSLDFEPLHADLARRISYTHPNHIPELEYFRDYRIVVSHSTDKNAALPAECNYVKFWYFFAHALVALEWFREYRFYTEQDLIGARTFQHSFQCLNNLVDGSRNYRLLLAARLHEHGVADCGVLTYKPSTEPVTLPDAEHTRIKNITTERHYDLGTSADYALASANINMPLHLSTFLNVVTETCYYESFHHLTEKVFKPIVMMQPFILVSTPGALAYLRSYGFQTFDRWIDESYDSITHPFKRLDAIAAEIARISRLSVQEQERIYSEMLPVLQYNRRHFYTNLYDIAYEEMWRNFDTCIQP